MYGPAAEFSAPIDRGAAGLARDFVRKTLADLRYAGDHSDVVLVVSELVSNALRHTATIPVIRLAGDERRLRIEVADSSPVLPRPRLSATVGGWGLQLVQQLTTAWGATPGPGGKVVWCEMAVPGTP
ncbi:ATP-binding protein [Saccharothrix sp. S26]|uniref:ATP-binding protein n=1 Tax=Saccharothrix sp. S26 TaxID=2907215 RepID=UPI001F2B7033|nr:ATP-binding protein [Saccharothrix sp. S26]MCE6998088.1 ATP-binding protein [Saccharothrix sp. S26]